MKGVLPMKYNFMKALIFGILIVLLFTASSPMQTTGEGLNSEQLAMYASVVLSLLFSYVPGLNTWYQTLDATKKSLIMLGLLVVVAGGSMGLACTGWGADFGLSLSCDRVGFAGLFQALLLAVIANQATYKLSPQVDTRKA